MYTPYKLAIIESPYANDIERNVAYAKAAMRDSIEKWHESPIASHLLYTQILDDNVPEERDLGIQLGIAWYSVPDVTVVFYIDYGMSLGMQRALSVCKIAKLKHVFRKIYESIQN